MPHTPPPAGHTAEHWHAIGADRVACTLCYRACELAPGEDGWCKARGNRAGRLVALGYGDVGVLWPLLWGYGIGWAGRYPGRLALEVGGFGCNARCGFCVTAPFSWAPERTPAHPEPHDPRPIYGLRARRTPAQVVELAERLGCTELFHTIAESLVNVEYTRDLARLALDRGITSSVFTNGFTGPAPVEMVAPYVDNIMLGVKGSGDPAFYERYMRSPGALPHVYAAALAFRDAGVSITFTDTIAALHQQDDATAEAHQAQYYGWIRREFGPTAVLRLGELHSYADGFGSYGTLVSGQLDAAEGVARTRGRIARALEIARAEGLHYVAGDDVAAEGPVTCHACGLVLVRPPRMRLDAEGAPVYGLHQQRDVHGACPGCGVAVPVHTLPGREAAINIGRMMAHPPAARSPRGLMRGGTFLFSQGEYDLLRAGITV